VYSDKKGAVKIFSTIVGTYKSLGAAQEAKEKLTTKDFCLGRFLIVKTNTYPKLSSGLYVIASFHTERKPASQSLKEVRKCNSNIKGYVKRAK